VFSLCRCRTDWPLACFIGMRWQAEPSDSQMTVSSRLKRSANAEGFHWNATGPGTDRSSLSDDLIVRGVYSVVIHTVRQVSQSAS